MTRWGLSTQGSPKYILPVTQCVSVIPMSQYTQPLELSRSLLSPCLRTPPTGFLLSNWNTVLVKHWFPPPPIEGAHDTGPGRRWLCINRVVLRVQCERVWHCPGQHWVCHLNGICFINQWTNIMWLTQDNIAWEDRNKATQNNSICGLQLDCEPGNDIITEAVPALGIDTMGNNQLCRMDNHICPREYILGMRYGNSESVQLPVRVQCMVCDWEFCGFFVDMIYNTIYSQPQVTIEISSNGDFNPSDLPLFPESPKDDTEVQWQLETYICNGQIRHGTSHNRSAVLFSPMEDGGLHMCIDYQAGNLITRKDSYPLSNIIELVKWLEDLNCCADIH